ncbi:MAG: hypothetical protein NVSMB43_20750 [Pseudarthrobacter sp.]
MFSTSPLILRNKLLALEDPLNNFAAQQVLPLALKDRLDAKSTQVLNKVSQALTTGDLLSLNQDVSGDRKMNPRDAAVAGHVHSFVSLPRRGPREPGQGGHGDVRGREVRRVASPGPVQSRRAHRRARPVRPRPARPGREAA